MNKIIICSISPQLFTSQSKVALNLLNNLSKNNLVASVSWLNNLDYLEEKKQNYYYNNHVVFPISNMIDKSAVEFYEINKALKANIVISIGSIEDVEFICGIKTLDKNCFKWIHYLTEEINEEKTDVLKLIDKIVVCNQNIHKQLLNVNIFSDINYFTADENVFVDKKLEQRKNNFSIINSSQNNSISNIGCFIEACSFVKDKIPNLKIYLNTSEYGDLDINKLIKKYNLEKIIELPNCLIDYNNGLKEENYINILNKCSLFIDCSCKSSINLRCLEASLTGCKCAMPKYSSLGDYKINGVKYISYNNKDLFICSPESLSDIIYSSYLTWKYNTDLNLTELNKINKIKLIDFNNNFNKYINEVLIDKNEINIDIIK